MARRSASTAGGLSDPRRSGDGAPAGATTQPGAARGSDESLWLPLDGEGPLARQIHRALRAAIDRGALAPGARLPATRALARELGVSRNTALAAMEQLLAEGRAESRRGAGTFVCAAAAGPRARAGGGSARAASATAGEADPRPPPEPQLSRIGARIAAPRGTLRSAGVHRLPALPFDFRYGQPAWLDLPLEAWQRCVGRALRGASARALDYGDPQGLPALREAIAERLGRVRGIAASAAQIVVVSGSQQGLDLAARLLLDPGDVALVEEPGYDGARRAFRAAGAQVVGAPVDGAGIDCARAPREAERARLVHVTPSHQYPLGAVLALARRRALLDLAERASARVIEDDYDAELRFDGPPLESLFALDGGRRVMQLGTFSKTLFPGLRLGYLVLPAALVAPFARGRMLADGGGSALEQRALAALLASGVFDRHVRRLRARLRERREALLDAIARELGDAVEIEGSASGMHLVMWLRDVSADRLPALVREAERRGVGLHPVGPLYEAPPPRAGVLLGYATLSVEAIRDGVAQLASALHAGGAWR